MPAYGSAIGPWIDGPDYDLHATGALIEGFVELFKAMMQNDLPDAERLGDVFDAVEFLPLELMRVGPSNVEDYLSGEARRFPELVPMALIFRHRIRGGASA